MINNAQIQKRFNEFNDFDLLMHEKELFNKK